MKNFIIGFLIASLLALGAGVVVYKGSAEPQVIQTLGAAAGPDYYNLQNFYGGLTEGSGQLRIASSTASSYQLTLNDMLNSSLITVATTTNTAAFSLRLPATSTFAALLTTVGNTREWTLRSDTGSTTHATTIVASSTTDLQIPETTGADAILNNGGFATLRCSRISTTTAPTTVCIFTETIVGD